MSSLRHLFRAIIALVVTLVFAPAAFAQTVYTYTAPTDGTIDGTTTCTSPLVRNFSVTNSFTVADVDIGVYATHAWRGDLRMTLQSPSGTRVQIVTGSGSISGDNFNVRFNDGGSQVVNTDGNTVNHSTAAPPPFANNFIPNAALSAFNNQSSAGTWQLEICDIYPSADNGTFRHAELYLKSANTNYADLSLTKTVSNAVPAAGSTITYTLRVTNAAGSPQSATGVVVRDLLPSGVTYISHSGTGTYSSSSGNWSVGSVAPGSTVQLAIQAQVNATAGASVTNGAEITASSVSDPDSTVNNGNTSEDDYASATFNVSGSRVAGTPPVLSCPNTSILFDWDLVSWTSGATSGSYPLGSLGNIAFALSNPDVWLNNASVGGQSPSRQNLVHGGTFEYTLLQLVDMANTTNEVTTTIELPAIMQGAQFSIFDVDYAAGQFADRVEVYGELDGALVYPTLTNGVSNYVIGNQAYGDGASDSDRSDGNITVTFTSPIDRMVIRYGNHSLAPANPGQQGISLHDMIFCRPVTTLDATKISSVLSDPINGSSSPKAIPGALIEYVIGVTNTGISPADNDTVTVIDDVPADAKMCVADLGGAGPILFSDGATASTLTYSFSSLADAGDDLAFSSDGGTSWTYVPTADADGCDSAITNFRVSPSGALAPGGSFTLRARFMVE